MIRSVPGMKVSGRLADRLTGVGVKVLPRLPEAAKWLLTGGRSINIDGNTLDRTLQLMLASQRAIGVNGLVVDGDPAASRVQMSRTIAALGGPEIHVHTAELALPGPAGELLARHYRPPGQRPAPLLVFYHGGGWVIGDLDSHDAPCRLVCRDAGIQVLSVAYRRAPEHPAPAAADDAYAAFRWAQAHAAELGADPARVAVGGDSAGGNLAAVVALRARDEGGPPPVLQWLLYPAVDFTARTRSRGLFADGFLLTKADMDWFQQQYLEGSGVAVTDPTVSPLLAVDHSGLAPALVITAGFDPLRDEGESYAAALEAAGTEVDLRRMGSLAHGFANLFPLGGGSADAMTEVVSALRAHLSRG
ncbi:lipase [Mycolicibacillus trivialis]|uniref:Lipase n=1 Tax=Mycolicibacillus trivialis TaxID=1798 RepID=A0A1X2EQH4_9MYCO|nr:alpha/beta hydrolase [Mycolicibacillus trivialis]ORX08451.1 lipase [Mycolicibacillus trivialis]